MTAFRRLARTQWSALSKEAGDLRGLLAGREPLVFRRYGHWWDGIEGDQIKVL